MARMVGFLKPFLMAGIACSMGAAPTFADEASTPQAGDQVVLTDVVEGIILVDGQVREGQPLFGPACIDETASQISCVGALTFTPDFGARVAQALAADDRLEMSAYDIGAALREQHDLITEFDALYRATSDLILQLVAMRADDRALIDALRIQVTRLTQELALNADSLTLAQDELALVQGQIRHATALIAIRDGEIATLKAELFATSNDTDDELVQLRLQLRDANELNLLLQDQLTEANLRIASLGDELSISITEREALSRQLTLESAKRLETEDSLAAAIEHIRTLEADLLALATERDGLVQTISEQAAIIDELRRLLGTAGADTDAIAAELTLLINDRDALLVRISELEVQLADATRQQSNAENNWQLVFIDLELAKTALEDAEESRFDAESRLADAEARLAELERALADALAANDQLERERDSAQDAAEDALEDLQLRDAAVLILQQNLADAQALVLDLRTQLDQALKAEDVLNAQISGLNDDVADRDAIIADLQAKLADAVVEVGEGSLDTARADAELDSALDEINQLNAQITILIAEADAAKAAHAEMQARCGDTGSGCAVIDDENAVDPTSIVIEGDDLAAQLLAARLELETLKAQQYVRVERVAEWLTAKMVGREDQAAIEFEPRRFSLLQDLLFDTNSAELNAAGEAELRRLALILRELEENPSVRQQVLFAGYPVPVDWVLQIAGHADPRPISGGPFADNWELASERALTVLRYLEQQGVSSSRLQAASYGDVKPVGGREREDEINRRVSFTIGIR